MPVKAQWWDFKQQCGLNLELRQEWREGREAGEGEASGPAGFFAPFARLLQSEPLPRIYCPEQSQK
jgi:hypothetical protein